MPPLPLLVSRKGRGVTSYLRLRNTRRGTKRCATTAAGRRIAGRSSTRTRRCPPRSRSATSMTTWTRQRIYILYCKIFGPPHCCELRTTRFSQCMMCLDLDWMHDNKAWVAFGNGSLSGWMNGVTSYALHISRCAPSRGARGIPRRFHTEFSSYCSQCCEQNDEKKCEVKTSGEDVKKYVFTSSFTSTRTPRRCEIPISC